MNENPERIDDVATLGPGDQAVLSQVRQVLEENGALDRFGLTLLHSHFDLAPDEVLVETVDAESRTLTIRPRGKVELMQETDPVETSWRLNTLDGAPSCVLYCHRTKDSPIHAT